MKILIVEDEKPLAENTAAYLKKEHFIVELAENYFIALDKLVSFDYDCILLDIMLPDGNGLDLLKELKNLNKSGKVIILSARDGIDDKVEGLDLGADDYLPKPFHLVELNARIKSVIRRNTPQGTNTIDIGKIIINLDNRSASVSDIAIQLNKKEFDILCYLAMNKNRLVNKSALAAHVWGDFMEEADDFEFMYSQIKNLRKKLSLAATGVKLDAVYGLGYKVTEE